MDGGGARLGVDDVALVEQRHGNAGATEHQRDDETDRPAARDDHRRGRLVRHGYDLFGGDGGFGRDHFLHGALPARVREIEHDADRVLVLDLIVSVGVVVLATLVIGAAGGHDLLGGFVEIVAPHAEMKYPVVTSGSARNSPGTFE